MEIFEQFIHMYKKSNKVQKNQFAILIESFGNPMHSQQAIFFLIEFTKFTRRKIITHTQNFIHKLEKIRNTGFL